MGKVWPIPHTALIAAVTFADNKALQSVIDKMTTEYGPLSLSSDIFDFTMTNYYASEMGDNLKKCFYCFERLISIEDLPDIKHFTNALEVEFAIERNGVPARTVNIDPGYITLSKLVLATTKDYSHRVYIGKGMYGEVELRYVKGFFVPLENTYPDYMTRNAHDFFQRAREFFKCELDKDSSIKQEEQSNNAEPGLTLLSGLP